MRYTVYCNGRCPGNGTPDARGGWGVYFDDPSLNHLNRCGPLKGPHQTSDRAHLVSVIRAIRLCPNDGSPLEINTNSEYCISIANDWIEIWRNNGWCDSKGNASRTST